jgi:hypothetical protein
MANMFKRAALAFGRFTGLKRRSAGIELFEPVTSEPALIFAESTDAGQSAVELGAADTTTEAAAITADAAIDHPALDARGNPWNDVLSANDALARQDTDAAIEAAIATGQFDNAIEADIDADSIKPIESPAIAAVLEPVAVTVTEAIVEEEEPAKIPVEVAAEEPVVIAAAPVETPAAPIIVEEAKPIIEMKPDPLKAPIPAPESHVTFTQLYELISGEVSKRTDSAVTVYERLLTATREELEATRKSNRIAWTVGGVMTAVAALGGVWAAGEVSANRVEVASLRQSVISTQQVSLERDQFRNELIKTREASARTEIDLLKSRLDQALTVTAERDRLKEELQQTRQARLDAESDLRLARAAAATQPVSQQKPTATAREAVAGAGAERPDVWSVLLDGKDPR